MMPKGKSGLAALIIAKEKPKSDSSEKSTPSYGKSEDTGSGDDEGLMSCADDLLSAVDEGSAKGVMNALKHFVDMYQGGGSEESGEESDDESSSGLTG